MRRLSSLALLAPLAAVAPGCRGATDPAPAVDFAVALDRAEAAPGDDVRITVSARNRTARPVSLGRACAPVGFRVLDASGRRVGPAPGWEGSFACIGRIDNTVPPRGQRDYVFLWTPIEDYGVATVATPLPPGVYAVVVGLSRGETLRPSSAPVPLRVVAP